MHELLWWHMFIHILNVEARRKVEVYDIINDLLPWLNVELWHYIHDQKGKGQGQKNVDFENQLKEAGVWDPTQLDQLFSSDSIPNSVTERLYDQKTIKDEIL